MAIFQEESNVSSETNGNLCEKCELNKAACSEQIDWLIVIRFIQSIVFDISFTSWFQGENDEDTLFLIHPFWLVLQLIRFSSFFCYLPLDLATAASHEDASKIHHALLLVDAVSSSQWTMVVTDQHFFHAAVQFIETFFFILLVLVPGHLFIWLCSFFNTFDSVLFLLILFTFPWALNAKRHYYQLPKPLLLYCCAHFSGDPPVIPDLKFQFMSVSVSQTFRALPFSLSVSGYIS